MRHVMCVHRASRGRCCAGPIAADVLVSHEALIPGTFGGCVDNKNVNTNKISSSIDKHCKEVKTGT